MRPAAVSTKQISAIDSSVIGSNNTSRQVSKEGSGAGGGSSSSNYDSERGAGNSRRIAVYLNGKKMEFTSTESDASASATIGKNEADWDKVELDVN